MTNSTLELSQYEIDPIRGFLPPQDPLKVLPSKFSAWEMAAYDLPKLLVTDQIRKILHELPLIDSSSLTTRPEVERGMMILSYLGHAYVWGEPSSIETLPQCLAVPWYELSKRLGRPPVLSYASYALWNWRRIDPIGPLALGNIALLQNFLGGIDEEWFILIHIDIEAKAAEAINTIPKVLSAHDSEDIESFTSELAKVLSSLSAINKIMDRMTEHCDPYIYYNRVRPYIHGWKDNPALPNGLIYEGVDEYEGKPQKFRGETGAQSSIVPALDAFLGISHEDDPLREYLNEMRSYMPPGHNAFINALEARSSIRDFVVKVSQNDPKIKELYNNCITEVQTFRSTHLRYAANYINKQKETSLANPTQVGTGGTPFMTYLAKHRDESTKHLL